jgi:hypothetical protein
VTAKTIPRHARTPTRQRPVPRPAPGRLPSPAAPGTAPRQLTEGQIPAGPLAGPVAITERAVLGDALRRPAVWCEMPGCICRHDHPDALGEADIRARALAAGWCHDAVGRLVCPSCQQRNPALWIAHRLARQHRPPTVGSRDSTGPARAGRLRGAWTAVSAQARALAGGQGRRRRWPHLIAALAGTGNAWNTPPPVPAPSAAGRRHKAGSAIPSPPAGRQAAAVAPATRGGEDHRHNQGQQGQQRHGQEQVSARPGHRTPAADRTLPQHHRR